MSKPKATKAKAAARAKTIASLMPTELDIRSIHVELIGLQDITPRGLQGFLTVNRGTATEVTFGLGELAPGLVVGLLHEAQDAHRRRQLRQLKPIDPDELVPVRCELCGVGRPQGDAALQALAKRRLANS